MEEVCRRIKQIRKEYALTQVEFSKRIGVTNAHISAIEKGKTIPSYALIKLISKEFKVNELWLTNGILPMFTHLLEDETEEAMVNITTKMNKIRTRDNIPIRSKVVQIEQLFAEILELNDVTEQNTENYLDICYKTFYHLNSFLNFQKKSVEQKQLHLFPFPDDLISNLKNDIQDFEDFFDKLLDTPR